MQFHVYGALIGAAAVLGWMFVEERMQRAGQRALLRALLWITMGAVLGARLYHLCTDYRLYLGKPLLEWIALWKGGLGIYGAVGGGFLALLLYARYAEWTFFQHRLFLDTVALILPWMQAVGRLGNWWNQELYGTETDLPWGIHVSGVSAPVHPLFAYEMLGLSCIGMLLFFLTKRFPKLGSGVLFGAYLAGYGLLRFWLEFLRPEVIRLPVLLSLSIGQIVSLGSMMLGAGLLFRARRSL